MSKPPKYRIAITKEEGEKLLKKLVKMADSKGIQYFTPLGENFLLLSYWNLAEKIGMKEEEFEEMCNKVMDSPAFNHNQ